MDRAEARARLAAADVARLATIAPDGRPHVVPICFVIDGDTIYSAIDSKPKATPELQRLRNIAAQPAAALLADCYDADWSQLWWVRADGAARAVEPGAERDNAVAALRTKYPQYAEHALTDAVLALDVSAWVGWAAGSARGRRPAPGR